MADYSRGSGLNRGDVLGVVLFASALFFAGMSTKLTSQNLRVAMLSIGCAVFLCTALWIATSPVTVSV